MSNHDFNYEEETDYSTRDQFGVIKYFNSIEEALSDFLEYEGYRLSISLKDKSVHFYRDELPKLNNSKPRSIGYENPTNNIEYLSKILVMKGNY